MSALELVPVTLAEAKAFVARHHRHNRPPVSWKFGVGAALEDELVGVAVAGRPVARKLDVPRVLEVTRTCTDGTRNANSLLYGAIARAARALGYRRLLTYTLEAESGASLRAAGWTIDEIVDPPAGGWLSRPRYETNLFGETLRPDGRKVRWTKELRS